MSTWTRFLTITVGQIPIHENFFGNHPAVTEIHSRMAEKSKAELIQCFFVTMSLHLGAVHIGNISLWYWQFRQRALRRGILIQSYRS